MRIAASSTNVSSGSTERMASIAFAVLTLSMRSSSPNTVWRAMESAGKLVSHTTRRSPCPIARKA
jgi:hypothetical protein